MILSNDQIFVPPLGFVLIFFPPLDLFWLDGRKTRNKVPFSLRHFQVTHYQLDLSLPLKLISSPGWGSVLVRLLFCKVTPFPHLPTVYLEGSHDEQPVPKEWAVLLPINQCVLNVHWSWALLQWMRQKRFFSYVALSFKWAFNKEEINSFRAW